MGWTDLCVKLLVSYGKMGMHLISFLMAQKQMIKIFIRMHGYSLERILFLKHLVVLIEITHRVFRSLSHLSHLHCLMFNQAEIGSFYPGSQVLLNMDPIFRDMRYGEPLVSRIQYIQRSILGQKVSILMMI